MCRGSERASRLKTLWRWLPETARMKTADSFRYQAFPIPSIPLCRLRYRPMRRGTLKVGGAYRVTDIKVGEEALDVNRTYSRFPQLYAEIRRRRNDHVCRCEYYQGRGYDGCGHSPAYINTNLGGNVGADYGDPHGQGRITVK